MVNASKMPVYCETIHVPTQASGPLHAKYVARPLRNQAHCIVISKYIVIVGLIVVLSATNHIS